MVFNPDNKKYCLYTVDFEGRVEMFYDDNFDTLMGIKMNVKDKQTVDSVKEAIAEDWYTCSVCGNLANKNAYSNHPEEIGYCFTCNFWMSKVGDTNRLIIEGEMFTICDEDSDSYFRGFGGRKFTILKDNKTIHTSNLWCQGDIPKYLIHLFPDNAKFIEE